MWLHFCDSWGQPLGQVTVTAAETVALLGLLNQEVSGDQREDQRVGL